MMGDFEEMFVLEERLMDVRRSVGDALVDLTDMRVEDLNPLTTDALVSLYLAVRYAQGEAFTAGVQAGGRDALALSDMTIENLGEMDIQFEPFEPLTDPRAELESLLDADAIVIDGIMQRIEEFAQRLEAIELMIGVKFAPNFEAPAEE